MAITDNEIRKIEELDDGSSLYEIGELPKVEKDDSFYDNLAIDFPEQALKRLSIYLLESIEEDIDSRKEWMESVEKVKQYLGFSIEDSKDAPIKALTRTFDTTLPTALIRFYATTRGELLPESGPAGFRINGAINEELMAKGEKIRNWLNYYLTVVDKSYYPDFERFLLYLGLYGTCFKKVYYDKIIKRPLSRFITPADFIIDSDCTSILESNRLTHVLHLSKREIILNQKNNFYRDVELSYLKSSENTDDDDATTITNQNEINLDVYTKRSLFPIYEVHAYLNLDDFLDITIDDKSAETVPLPYIVTIDKISKEILSIRRNWKEEDQEQKRRNYFVQYNYLPGFGILGIGLGHLLGSNAIALTKIERLLIDAGIFKNLPGGFRVKGSKAQQNDIKVGPGEFVEVDTGTMPLQQAFMPLPYSEPSAALRELRMELIAQTKELGSTSEMGLAQSGENTAVGTTLAMLETNNKIQSAVLKSIHYSLTCELQLIDEIFRETLESESFNFQEKQQNITVEDFTDEISIIPVSDPSVNSTTQKIMRAESIRQTAQQFPDLHNMSEILRIYYKALGLSDKEIDKILKPDPQEMEIIPLDPVTENINIMKGMPVKAAEWQNHAAHKLVHGLFGEENPDLKPVLMAHIREHDAMEYLIKMQQMIGINLPPLDELQDPQVQNMIAMATAQSLEDSGATEQQQPEQRIDPNALLMADIQQKEAETLAKERIANLKAETDIFKTQAKIESNEDIAQLKSETELIKQESTNAY
jgi:hypothetical protein